MIRFGHGKTRVTLAWLAGAAMACALIGTCLALLRSDVLPFRDAWPSTHGTRTPVSELAPPQPASQPDGRPAFAAQPTTVGGVPVIGLPGVSVLPTATGPLAPATGTGPLGTTLPGTGAAPAPTQTTNGGTVGPQGTDLSPFPATAPPVPATTTTTAPSVPAATTPDVAAPGADPVQTSAASRPGPSGRTSDADATRADDAPPADTSPATDDAPASPVDGDTPAGPADATAPAADPTPAPSAPADSAPAAETPPASTTPPADATSQPADPGPAETPPAEDPAPAPPADTPPQPEQAASTPAPPAEVQPEQPAQTPPPADPAPQPDAPAAPGAPGGCSH